MKIYWIFIVVMISGLVSGQVTNFHDKTADVFVVSLKPGLDSVKAIINDSTIFIARKGQLMLYWNYPHTAFIADGRFGYIPPDQLVKVDKPCFKFNFSKGKFTYNKKHELFQITESNGVNLNDLIKQIQNKNSSALLRFFNFREIVDAASAEAFPEVFWALINLWTDNELSSFILSLDISEKKAFCELLISSSYCSPFEYYRLYYPLTLYQINKILPLQNN